MSGQGLITLAGYPIHDNQILMQAELETVFSLVMDTI